MDLTRLQIEMERAAFLSWMWTAIGAVLTVWILYEVLKAAIRNGINESKLTKPERALPPRPGLKEPKGYKWVLVKEEDEKDDFNKKEKIES